MHVKAFPEVIAGLRPKQKTDFMCTLRNMQHQLIIKFSGASNAHVYLTSQP